MKEILDQVYFNNSVQDYLISGGIIALGILLIRLFRKIILRQLKKLTSRTENTLDDFLVSGIERFGLPLLNLVVVYYGLKYLEFADKIHKGIDAAITVVFTYYMVKLVLRVIRLSLEQYILRQEGGEEKLRQVKGVNVVISIVVWSLGLVFLLDNLGYDITAIVTGLGIGGIAIALAAQNILGDLFNYFVIFLDRPFEIGDFLVVDEKRGTVEYIGVKSTRIKSLNGEQLIFSNSDLTNARIHNFKRMERRRILFTIGVTYQTTTEQLKRIPRIIKEAIETQPLATFDRSHFSMFDNYSLNFESVYFVESSDFLQHMDIQQNIYLLIYETFEREGIQFAYPTQTIYTNPLPS
jgi:small-conductance mechanosensitive channel